MKVDYMVAFSGIQKQQILDKYGLDGGRTQKVIDSQFMAYMDMYMPMGDRTGVDEVGMITSMHNSTKVGSGEININKPYAHYQHEGELYVDPKTRKGAFYDKNSGRYWSRKGIKKIPSGQKLNYHGGSLRGDHFVERMLADHFNDILEAGQKEIEKMSEQIKEKATIDEVRDYISTCPYLKEFAELNVEYLADKVNTYSVNENAGYNPVLNKFLYGSENQFLFTFDSKLYWNEDVQNNIDNSKFFEDFKNWLETNNKDKKYPNIRGIYEIGATTNGYICATNANEAIYRIQCYLKYTKFN